MTWRWEERELCEIEKWEGIYAWRHVWREEGAQTTRRRNSGTCRAPLSCRHCQRCPRYLFLPAVNIARGHTFYASPRYNQHARAANRCLWQLRQTGGWGGRCRGADALCR
ncbi:hypothetical protein FA95DRAFT_1215284 [Auriscalpium vulgare]|uniref:Uncharacterized protein n=1 Tax=Auriscalpium vulgare TaxID=40419 RepID=A0ACB8RUS9_9AGAM|nr:hypothetical protein FA95DRAFT_1215284 [Auriscalpium vulgare]